VNQINITASLVVKGSKIIVELAKSPISIIVYLVIILTLIGTYRYYRGKPGGRAKIKLTIISLIAVIIILAAIPLTMISWSENYGVWVEGKTIYVRYYNDDIFKADLCTSNLSLISTSKARKMLSIRTNGVSDPFTHIDIGHFKLRDGSKGDVIILDNNSNYVLLIAKDNEKALVSLKGIETFYNKLVSLRQSLCGS